MNFSGTAVYVFLLSDPHSVGLCIVHLFGLAPNYVNELNFSHWNIPISFPTQDIGNDTISN